MVIFAEISVFVKRRKAIKQIGLGLSAGLIMPQFLASCSKVDPGPEVPFDGIVAIIGAGAAGLYVADILRAKGIEVAIYEATNQGGGRVKSLRNQIDFQSLYGSSTLLDFGVDFPLEMGADTVVGTDSILGKIVSTGQIPTSDLSLASHKYILGNQSKSAIEWQSDADFASAQNFINAVQNYAGADVSVEQAAAGIASRAQGILNSQIGNTYGSSNNRIGILPLFKAIKKRTHDGKMLLPKSNPLQDILLSRFSLVTPYIKFNTPIKSVNYSGDVILLTDKSGNQFEAKKVIVTVPISIVKSGAISFSPGLPASMTGSLNKFGMDSSMKFIFDFKKNFWGDGSGFVWGGTTAPQYLNTGVGRSTLSRTLAITVNGPAAATLSAMTRENQLKAILAELDSVYAGQASQFLRYTLSDNGVTPAPPVYPIVAVKDWGKDEYAKGGQSYPLPGATDDDRVNIGQPINKKLFFAGEATDVSGDAGTINGALASAERAANEVINSILEA